MIFGVEDDIEGNGLRGVDKGNKVSFMRRVEGAWGDDTRGDDTGGEKVVCAGREKRGQNSIK
jgi:hypothetical protein